MSDPVESETAKREGPKQLDAEGLAQIHEEMEKGGAEGNEEDGREADLFSGVFGFKEEKWERNKETKKDGREDGVKVSAMEGEIGGRAEVTAERVQVRDGAGDNDGERSGSRQSGEGGAFQRVGCEGVGERVHEGVISQKQS